MEKLTIESIEVSIRVSRARVLFRRLLGREEKKNLKNFEKIDILFSFRRRKRERKFFFFERIRKILIRGTNDAIVHLISRFKRALSSSS